ncbi:MAG: GNAT family N-acetyltransferase [Sphingobacterium sp.]|jgi:ribosomal protein S18 acetylase RimI-like enzyme|nr:GNAT family N-acetyltransferase [Sphingobacterium sp.]
MRYKSIYDTPSADSYRHLRVASGLSPKTEEAAIIGLKNSLCCVLVVDQENNDEIIGMGRLVGDGGCHCQVVDICVLPEHQKKGLGKLIMQMLDNFVQKELPASCYINLIADGDAFLLYKQYGFEPVWPQSRGMGKVKRKD